MYGLSPGNRPYPPPPPSQSGEGTYTPRQSRYPDDPSYVHRLQGPRAPRPSMPSAPDDGSRYLRSQTSVGVGDMPHRHDPQPHPETYQSVGYPPPVRYVNPVTATAPPPHTGERILRVISTATAEQPYAANVEGYDPAIVSHSRVLPIPPVQLARPEALSTQAGPIDQPTRAYQAQMQQSRPAELESSVYRTRADRSDQVDQPPTTPARPTRERIDNESLRTAYDSTANTAAYPPEGHLEAHMPRGALVDPVIHSTAPSAPVIPDTGHHRPLPQPGNTTTPSRHVRPSSLTPIPEREDIPIQQALPPLSNVPASLLYDEAVAAREAKGSEMTISRPLPMVTPVKTIPPVDEYVIEPAEQLYNNVDRLAIDRPAGHRPPPYVPSTTYTSSKGKTRQLTSFFVRPGYGERGRPIDVESNFFAVRTSGNRGKTIYHYDVDINPVVKAVNQKKPKQLIRSVWEQLCQDNSTREPWALSFVSSAFDGRRNAFTPIAIPIPEGQVQHFTTALQSDNVVQKNSSRTDSSDDENKRWKVSIKLVAVVDLEAVMEYCRGSGTVKIPQNLGWGEERFLTALMTVNVLLRDLPSKTFAQVGATGNRFFTLENSSPIPQGGMVHRGFMQSFRHSSSGLPLLNIDVAFSAFLATGPALEVIAKILQRGGPGPRPPHGGGPPGGFDGRGGFSGNGQMRDSLPDIHALDQREITIIKHKLRGAKFTVTHRNSSRLHTIMSISYESADSIKFAMQDKATGASRSISITQYYQDYYNTPVTRPRLPCIQYGAKLFVPLEFARIAEWNSLPPPKLTAEQTAAMIKVAAMRPPDRAADVLEWRKKLDYQNQPKIREWGLQVNSKLLKLKARILPPPLIVYQNNITAHPVNGSWNIRDFRFFQPGKRPLVSWSWISFERHTDEGDMERYCDYLVNTLQKHGVPVKNRRPAMIPPTDPRNMDNVKQGLQLAARGAYMGGDGGPPQLIVCVLPGRDAYLYEMIKRMTFAELKAPVPTQCIQATKIKNPRGLPAYTGNLVMKVQSKLGGITHHIPLEELPGMIKGKTMLLGADLGQPPIKPGYDSAPTVACSIATYNADCSLYSAQIRLQEGRDEIVKDFSLMIEEHLKLFARHNNALPERILIFRDGISEGQYAAALTFEHDAVLSACTRLQPGYRPKILICVCAKRHNTRFFGQVKDLDGSGNLPCGLVVDRSVTHPYAYDFFLQAHQGRVGTARPTHYICLLDELGLTPDQLQQLVHSLCYAFARCTKSVSLVPVCYIADLVCQKARIIVHDPERGTSYAPSESSAGKTNKSKKTDRIMGNVDIMQVQRLLAKNPDLSDVMWWM